MTKSDFKIYDVRVNKQSKEVDCFCSSIKEKIPCDICGTCYNCCTDVYFFWFKEEPKTIKNFVKKYNLNSKNIKVICSQCMNKKCIDPIEGKNFKKWQKINYFEEWI